MVSGRSGNAMSCKGDEKECKEKDRRRIVNVYKNRLCGLVEDPRVVGCFKQKLKRHSGELVTVKMRSSS